MPRPRRCRRVGFLPGVNFFKPAGVRVTELEEVVLTVDEYESVRLKDMEGLDQAECAKKMKISQPTFHRLVISARKKIAEAIVKGKAIRIEGGTYKITGLRGGGRRQGYGGPPGACICPACGATSPKRRGIPCTQVKCPKCSALMVRGS
jgi:predicted DNA-binding protein (UPF0251 family)